MLRLGHLCLLSLVVLSVFAQSTLKATHFWDCNGMGCDSTRLSPWDPTRYLASFGYAPQDPNNHGGATQGEKLWIVGAASDTLAHELGTNDACCGRDTNMPGGCGKCILITNKNALQSSWKAIVMVKSRCPPWSNGCGAGQRHMDFAVPGYDNLQYSTANICNNPKSGFTSQAQSAVCGTWYNSFSDTSKCYSKCSSLPPALKTGCEVFSLWGWKSGDPIVEYSVVPCPPRFKSYIGSLFGASGPVTTVNVPTSHTLGGVSPDPTPTPTPTPTPSPSVQVEFQNSNEYWIQFEVAKSLGVPSGATLETAGSKMNLQKAGWSPYVFAQNTGSRIPAGQAVQIVINTPFKTITINTKWLQWTSATQTAVLEVEKETEESNETDLDVLEQLTDEIDN